MNPPTPFLLKLRYGCVYSFGAPVGFSVHEFRVFPRVEMRMKVRRIDFETNPGASVHWRRDLYDNPVACCFYPDPANRLHAELKAEIEISPWSPFEFLLENAASNFPFAYGQNHNSALHQYLINDYPDISWKKWIPDSGSTVEVLSALLSVIHQRISYQRRDTGAPWTPGETIAKGFGSCRDQTALAIAILRNAGIAARWVSGFLLEDDRPESQCVAQGAMHAWVEVFLPGAGWTGLDPTNGYWCNHLHIPAAVGPGPDDVTPVRGRIAAERLPAQSLETRVELLVAPLPTDETPAV